MFPQSVKRKKKKKSIAQSVDTPQHHSLTRYHASSSARIVVSFFTFIIFPSSSSLSSLFSPSVFRCVAQAHDEMTFGQLLICDRGGRTHVPRGNRMFFYLFFTPHNGTPAQSAFFKPFKGSLPPSNLPYTVKSGAVYITTPSDILNHISQS